MSANVARANFYQIIEEAGEDLRLFTIVPRNKSPVIIMSVQEFEGWQETLEIMSDKKLVRDIQLGEKQLKAGKGIPWEKVRKMVK